MRGKLLVEQMVKLIEVESRGGYRLALRFADGASGVFDFTPFIEADTSMTEPLRNPTFFARHCIELGALAWPNGLDFSAGSLYRRLQDAGKLTGGKNAA